MLGTNFRLRSRTAIVDCDILRRYFCKKSFLFDARLNDRKEDGCCVKRFLGGMGA